MDDEYLQRLGGTPPRPPSHSGSPRRPARASETYGDRFIPLRTGSSIAADTMLESMSREGQPAESNTDPKDEPGKVTYNLLLRNEVLGANVTAAGADERRANPLTLDNVFSYRESHVASPARESHSPFSLSPVGSSSQRLLQSPRKHPRKIAKVPFKVLDAPDLQDDFYLNLVDWSSQNVLAVGLGSAVYLWSACTSQVTKLCDLKQGDLVASVRWMQRGSHLAVGTTSGEVMLWDAQHLRRVRTLTGHTSRAGSLAWNASLLSSGSRDRSILQRDVRVPEQFVSRLSGHKQEVCGLQWSPDDQHLASGGNDNKLFIWSATSTNPLHRFNDHNAAVKAIAWSPHQHGLLASGGGTADQCIRFWNTVTFQPLQVVDTKSQVCNIAWSKSANELVSTHGYSQNQVIVWKYPSMTQVATLTGHTMRVLYLAMSPDGQTIVTGAGDETLRFWNVFGKAQNSRESRSVLSLASQLR
eukprot:m.5442 g.5442  ORF g.5442 m.5442 type:complete len:471 (-) comp2006_c0_seq1:181-1593(-)